MVGFMEVGKREITYLSLYCHHQNDSCRMGSDESHLNDSLIVRDKVTRLCPKTTTFLKRKESRSGIEPMPFCLPALQPSGQNGSQGKSFCRLPLVVHLAITAGTKGAGLWNCGTQHH